MMKSMYRPFVLLGLLFITIVPPLVNANDGDQPGPYGDQTSTYLLNLGGYLGYDLATTPPTPPAIPSPLLPLTSTELLGSSSGGSSSGNAPTIPFFSVVFDVLLGAIPVDTSLLNSDLKNFFPSSEATYSPLNTYANNTFTSYSSVSSSQQSNSGSLSASTLIDQNTIQQDPVSQAVLNILGTPDYTYCMNNDANVWTGGTSNGTFPSCSYLYGTQVMNNVLGTLPGGAPGKEFFSYAINQQLISQLNSNSLLGPMLYSTTGEQQSTSSSQPQQNGLPAQSQAQQAANFIRYATSGVAPLALPKYQDYTTLYAQATNAGKNTDLPTQLQAQTILANYFTSLRVYAAQSSVAISNLYYILSKRMPQKGTSDSALTSQSLTEFTMATWRLYTPGGNANAQWLNQINNASSATVQKEMVTLLAEINYQLYLNRQQEERLLLTNSILVLQNSRAAQPTAPSTSDGSTPQPPAPPAPVPH